jgi:hypothetical protein
VTKCLRVAVYSLVALFCALPASAAPIIDFIGLNGGTVSYAGGLNPLVGTGIDIDIVFGVDTPAGTDPNGYAVTNGRLDFTTGDVTGYDAGSGTYTFSGNGTFTITGGVAAAGIASGTQLLWGSFIGAEVSAQSGVRLFIGNGTDSKDPQLVAFFGLAPDSKFAFSGTTKLNNFTVNADGSFSGDAFSTDVSNTVVPEPGSMMLFGSGLVGLSALMKRRKQRQQAQREQQ